jgi:hydroxyacylglutathione hydrolase
MKRVNAEGPPVLDGLPGLRPIPARRFKGLVDEGHVVIDLRSPLAYGGDHVPGSFSIPLAPPLSTWAAWVVPYDVPILLVGPDPRALAEGVRALVRVGIDDVTGYLDGGMASWYEEGLPVKRTAQISPAEVHEALNAGRSVAVIDVRSASEWHEAHVAGALHVTGGELASRLDEVPSGADRIAVICGSGYRSSVATSVMERAGLDGAASVANVTGGITAWRNAGLPVVTG